MKLGFEMDDSGFLFSLSKPCEEGCPSLDGCTLRLRRTYNGGYTDIYAEYPGSVSEYVQPPSFTAGGCVVSMQAEDQGGGDFICIQADGTFYSINSQVNPDDVQRCEDEGGKNYDPEGIQVWATVEFGQGCAPVASQNYSPVVVRDIYGNLIENDLSNTTPLGPLPGWTIEIHCP